MMSLVISVTGLLILQVVGVVVGRLGDPSRPVQRLVAQLVLVLARHGALAGQQGSSSIQFIVKLCCAEETRDECGKILQLLTTSVPRYCTALLSAGLYGLSE